MKKYFSICLIMFLILINIVPQTVYAQYRNSGNDKAQLLAYILIILIISIIIFLIGREIVCWYFKINERLALLKEIRDSLRTLSQNLSLLKNSNSLQSTNSSHALSNDESSKESKGKQTD